MPSPATCGRPRACASPLRGAPSEIAHGLFAPAVDAPDHWSTRTFAMVGPAFLLSQALTFVRPAAWAAVGAAVSTRVVVASMQHED